MKYLLLSLLFSFNLFAATGIPSGGGTNVSGKNSSFNSEGISSGLSRSDYNVVVHVGNNGGATASTFKEASGTAYDIPSSGTATLKMVVCSCREVADANSNATLISSTTSITETAYSFGRDRPLYYSGTGTSVNSTPHFFTAIATKQLTAFGHCSQAYHFDVDLVAAFMPARPYFGLAGITTNAMDCTAYIDEQP